MAWLPPLLQLAATQPQLLAEHAGAWAQLLAAECTPAARAWRRRLLWASVAGVAGLLGLALAGVALMLWGLAPPAALAGAGGPLLLATPALPWAVAALAAWRARGRPQDTTQAALARLRRQWLADLALLGPAGGA